MYQCIGRCNGQFVCMCQMCDITFRDAKIHSAITSWFLPFPVNIHGLVSSPKVDRVDDTGNKEINVWHSEFFFSSSPHFESGNINPKISSHFSKLQFTMVGFFSLLQFDISGCSRSKWSKRGTKSRVTFTLSSLSQASSVEMTIEYDVDSFIIFFLRYIDAKKNILWTLYTIPDKYQPKRDMHAT